MQRNRATIDFIRQHQDEDVRQLAFLGSKFPEVDLPFALDQIRGRKMARVKLPRWANIDGIVYPPHISMEQCSSEQTALYKAELAERWLESQNSKIPEFPTENADASKFAENEGTCEHKRKLTETDTDVNGAEFVDLTGGFGVDFSYIAARLGVKSVYVERQAHLCEVAKENFKLLGLENAVVKNGDGVEVLHSLAEASDAEGTSGGRKSRIKLLFIDPARRDGAGNKVVSLQDCTPDVTLLQDKMLSCADVIIIKLSPMLDWHRAVEELSQVREVHIVSAANECKELLLVLSAKASQPLRIYCVNDAQEFIADEESIASSAVSLLPAGEIGEAKCLYEPNPSLMKAGCFGVLSRRYGAKMLSQNSHLFVSQSPIAGFPGRTFRIIAVTSLNKKELKRRLASLTHANIATRNFPLSVADLRKRLKLKDGGDTYLFATTLADGSHVLLVTKKENSTL